MGQTSWLGNAAIWPEVSRPDRSANAIDLSVCMDDFDVNCVGCVQAISWIDDTKQRTRRVESVNHRDSSSSNVFARVTSNVSAQAEANEVSSRSLE